MHRSPRLLSVLLLALFCVRPAHAQTTITYVDGENRATVIATASPDTTTLTIASGAATQSGAVTGDGALIKTGSGQLSVGNTLAGHTGSLELADGTLVFDAATDQGYGGALSGPGLLWKAGASALSLSGDLSGFTGNLRLTGGGTLDFNPGADTTLAASLSAYPNWGTLRKSGVQTLTLASALHAFNGPFHLDTGTLRFAADNRFSFSGYDSSVSLVIAGGATLDLNGTAQTIQLATSAGTIDLAGGSLKLWADTDTVFSGTIRGAGQLTLLGGTLTGIDASTATITVNGDTRFAQRTALANGDLASLAGRFTVNYQAIFSVGGAGEFTAADLSALSLTGPLAGSFNSGAILGIDTTNATAAVVLSSAYANGLRKYGSGTLVLTGNNTGWMRNIDAGTVQVGDGGTSGALSSSVPIIIASGASLVFKRSDDTSVAIEGTGTLIQAGTGILDVSNRGFSGNIVIASGTLSGGSDLSPLNITNDGEFRLSMPYFGAVTQTGTISGSGRFVLSGYSGPDVPSTLTLLAEQTYTGGTRIEASTLILGASERLANTGAVTVAGGTFALGAFNETIGAFSFSSGALTGTGKLTASSFNFAHANALTVAATLAGTGSLTKAGAGTLTFNAANTYTGATVINAGTLALGASGSLANTSGIHVATGATFDVSAVSGFTLGSGQILSGTGTVAGLLTVGSGAHLAPGNSPGTLTFSNGLTLNDGAILDFQLGDPLGTAGVASDLIVVSSGTLTGSASADGITVNLTDAGGFGAGTYDLIRYTGVTVSFDLTDFHVGSGIAGYDYTFGFSGSTLQLTATAVPEPATWAMLFGLGALGLVIWRRHSARTKIQ